MTLTNDITTQSSTVPLTELDEKLVQGLLLVEEAVLGYAQHGMSAAAISQRVKDLGARIGDSTVRRWINGFRAKGLIPEKVKSDNPEAVKSRKRREKGSNAQNEQMTQPAPEPSFSYPDPEPVVTLIDDAPVITPDSELYSHLNGLLCDFLIRFDELPWTAMPADEWDALQRKAEAIVNICSAQQSNLQRYGQHVPERSTV